MSALFLIFAMVCLVAVSYGFAKCRHPVLTAAKSSVTGLSAMLLVNLVSGATGCYIAINTATVFVSTVLSLPGVIRLLLLKIIYNY